MKTNRSIGSWNEFQNELIGENSIWFISNWMNIISFQKIL